MVIEMVFKWAGHVPPNNMGPLYDKQKYVHLSIIAGYTLFDTAEVLEISELLYLIYKYMFCDCFKF
jgi:hypothetical protein